MQFLRVLALRGPNIWARFPVLEAWVDLEDLKDVASSEIPGFNQRLQGFLPSLIEHRCSVGQRGGFYERLDRGTYMAHILEHVVLELQTLAGTEVGFGRTRLTNRDGVYKVALEYAHEDLARAALEVGRDLCLASVHDQAYDVAAAIDRLRQVAAQASPPPVLAALAAAAEQRRIPARRIEGCDNLIQLGWGAHQRRLLDGQTDRSSAVGNSIAYDRQLTRSMLQAVGAPTPWGRTAASAEDARAAAEEMTFPVVLRPRFVSGRGQVSALLANLQDVDAAYRQAEAEGWSAIVEHRSPGEEFHLLVIGSRLLSARNRDGAEVQAKCHPAVVERAVDAVHALGLEIGIVEVVAQDLAQPLEAQEGVIVGILGQPDLTHYLNASTPVAQAIIDHLYPEPRAARIPIVGVTGTNGKTTTTRLTAHILGRVYRPVGMCCTEGIYLGSRRIMTGDCSGPKSAKAVLHHPEPRAAVLETARGGILREGLGFDRCDVAIVTNIGEGDHLGTSDIDTPEQLASVKSTLVWTVAPTGVAVLNASDPLVVAMKQYCDGSIIYFARQEQNPVVVEHRKEGGRAVFTRDNAIILAEGESESVLVPLSRVPLTRSGRVGFHVENTLASVAAAWALGLPNHEIVAGLETFNPGMDHVPARFNMLDLRGVTVVLDYGHNTSALAYLIEVLEQLPHERRSIVYSAAGDRRDADIIAQGEQLGNAFDQVWLYEDTYLRGRKEGEISGLFRQGMANSRRVREIHEIRGGMLTIERALAAARPGELLVIQPDLIDDGVTLLKRFLAEGGREVCFEEVIRRPFPEAGVKTPATIAITIGDSNLGKAIYANRDLEVGEVIYRGWGPITDKRSKYTIQVDHDRHLIPDSPLKFFNHSCEPNCGILLRAGVDLAEVHVLQPVAEGEELTLDYETFEMEFEELTGPCLCRSPRCRGQLSGYRDLPQEQRDAYGIYVAEYLREADVPIELPVTA